MSESVAETNGPGSFAEIRETMRDNDDSRTPAGDPVIRELWAVKDAMAADCGYDAQELFRRIRARQETSGRDYVRLPRRRASPTEPEVADRRLATSAKE